MNKQIPNVIGIGASYAGLRQVTTWLSDHPAVADLIPACNFFNTITYEKKSIDTYRQIFTDVGNEHHLKVDSTPGYLSHPEAAARIAQDVPDVKLFVVVRHPVMRALAEYDALKRMDETATKQTAGHYVASHPGLQKNGYYAEHLERYFEYFSPRVLHVILYEELVASPLIVMQQLYKFLDIDSNFIPKDLKPYAPPPEEPKHPSLIYRVKRSVRKFFKRLTTKPAPPLFTSDEALRGLLTASEWEVFTEHMKPDIKRLSFLLNRDMLVTWGLKEE